MKQSLIAALGLVVFSTSFASTNHDSLLKKVEQKIEFIEGNKNKSPTESVDVTIPWDVVDQREARLMNSIVNAYDHLKGFSVTERYIFMYSAMKASSLPHKEKIQALKKWIREQKTEIAAKKLHPSFYQEWNRYTQSIEAAISDLAKARPQVKAYVTNQNYNQEQYDFLKEVRAELRDNAKSATSSGDKKHEFIRPLSEEQATNHLYLLAGCLASLAAGLLLSPKKKTKPTVEDTVTHDAVAEDTHEKVIVLPQLPDEAFETTFALAVDEFTGVNLDDECRKIIEENAYLLELAQVKVHPTHRSPFKTSVNVPPEQMKEALNWLLKGTLAIANSQATRVSHMDWSCKENAGRISLDFTLHGPECDLNALYMNVLVEGESSAPAHFSRTELALEGHLPSVVFKSGNKRTTVSLALDSMTGVSH